MKISVKTYIPLLCGTLFCLTARAQDIVKTQPEFKNQREQEIYWIKQIFKNEYKTQEYNMLPGKLDKSGGMVFWGIDSLFITEISPKLRVIFVKGLIYPQLINGRYIENIQELKFVEQGSERKRFKLVVGAKDTMNPVVYFFELTNKNATKSTSFTDFLSGARLTFFKQAWVML